MTTPVPSAVPALCTVLAFDGCNQLAVRRTGPKLGLAFPGADLPMAVARLEQHFKAHTPPKEYFSATASGSVYRAFFTQVTGAPADIEVEFLPIGKLRDLRSSLAPTLQAILDQIEPHLIDIPYLHLGENDYIYRFRVDRNRNRGFYVQDDSARALYQSKLCEAIKALARTNERSASRPAMLDFGAVRYVIPSHFGFCLGVKNAIERAYETLADNPGRRVFMLSELIHNSFVNEDLQRRGLLFLQTDQGRFYPAPGQIAAPDGGGPLLWDTLTSDDIVIIPAFGATDDDKRRLIVKGIRVAQYDATCMLVEKVWKAARAFGRAGYTVVIHGKSEHEETKATFSNSRRYAPSLIIRNAAEARLLGDCILHPTPEKQRALAERFAGNCTPGFDFATNLDRLAIVNQTTLLMNETAEIIDYFRSIFVEKFGESAGPAHVGGAGHKDTLCYATQVNQDALIKALTEPLDAAFVIGGKNSSNTYQLYRLCQQMIGPSALFIQSEANIRGLDAIDHYVFPARGPGGGGGRTETHALPAGRHPLRILLTGGASCPDGLIQQVILRLNSLLPADQLRNMDEVLADLH
ncbi:MAG: 4-hydroxy-3-methylbut-2-enyl diphosphate reductase [Opitutaceae bacterium]|nr:4-hydroxy-3-methylbut-2-enyl diphosphate reductase [Opitutaceae bacterium]